MINIKRFVHNAKKMYPLMEESFSDLRDKSDSARKARSVGMVSKFQNVDQGQHGHARTHWKVPSQSGSGDYDVVVEIHVPLKGGLFSMAKGKWEPKKFSQALAKSNVKVHCSCKDFYWSGMKYNLGPAGEHKGSLSPNQNAGHEGESTVVTKAPDVRDPERKHVLCKHLLATFKVFPFNASSIMGQAKKYDNNIVVNDEISRDLDQGRKALGKDIELVEVGVEDKETITDTLSTATSELHKNNENEGSEELIERRDEPEEITREVSDTTEDIIEDKNEIEETPDDNPENAQELIDEENDIKQQRAENSEEIIEEENKSKENVELEKDKEDSDVSDDVNDLLGK